MAHSAVLHDLEALAGSGATRQQLDDALADNDTAVMGYWEQSALVGYAMITRLPFDAELQAIGVAPQVWGKGVGGRLMSAVIACAQTWESERLLLEVRVSNQRAIRLYRHYGFTEDGRRKGYYPAVQGAAGREDALLMSRRC
nr:ribosomal protein S18-alanine N-acetyltransferase [Halomonas olivaria]